MLSRDTGFSRLYGNNPYLGYARADSPAFLFSGETDGRLPPKERVVTFDLAGDTVAYPFARLAEERVVQDEVGREPVVLFWRPGTRSALDESVIAESADVGAAGVFSRELGGRVLTFVQRGGELVDEETGSSWNLLGQAVVGELRGRSLTPIVHDNMLWFAWAAFKPETRIYGVGTPRGALSPPCWAPRWAWRCPFFRNKGYTPRGSVAPRPSSPSSTVKATPGS